ncbi:MAG: hypothetical protein AAB502_02250, partial [Chloroflexota bacterium]
HWLYLKAEDNVGNQLERSTVPYRVVIGDLKPPRSSLEALGGISGGGTLYVSSAAVFNLASADDLADPNDDLGNGAISQSVSMDGVLLLGRQNPVPSRGVVFSSTFSLGAGSDGLHVLSYYAQDAFSNREAVKVATVAVDNSPHTLIFESPLAGSWVNSARPQVRISYADANIGAGVPGSGVETSSLHLALDGQDISGQVAAGPAFAEFTPADELGEGPHTLEATLADKLGNRATSRIEFSVDVTTPLVRTLSPPHQAVLGFSTPTLSARYSDGLSRLRLESLKLLLDGSEVQGQVSHDSSPGGEPGAWENGTQLPYSLRGHAAVAYNGHVYFTGGATGGALSKRVFHAESKPDKSLGPWLETSSLPFGRASHRMAAANGRLYVFGGTDDNQALNDARSAQMLPDGSLGAWKQEANMPFSGGAYGLGAASVNGFVYIMGGQNFSCTVHRPVYYAKACPGGLCHPDTGSTTAPWKQTVSLPLGVTNFDAAEMESCLHVYVPGGNIAGCGTSLSNTAYHASANPATGELSSWSTTALTIGEPKTAVAVDLRNNWRYNMVPIC